MKTREEVLNDIENAIQMAQRYLGTPGVWKPRFEVAIEILVFWRNKIWQRWPPLREDGRNPGIGVFTVREFDDGRYDDMASALYRVDESIREGAKAGS